jgi:hypothetical protein
VSLSYGCCVVHGKYNIKFGRTLWTGDRPVEMPALTQGNTNIEKMKIMGFEATILLLEQPITYSG